MKKRIVALFMAVVFVLGIASVSFAETDYDTLGSWEIKVAVPDGGTGVMMDDEYYVFTTDIGAIPYVMLYAYTGFEDEVDLLDSGFVLYMYGQYDDLQILEDVHPVSIDGVEYYEIDFGYTIQGYDVLDRRVLKTFNGFTYMFTSKEVAELGKTLDGMLEKVISESIFLVDGEPVDLSWQEEGGGDYQPDIPEIWWEDYEYMNDLDGKFVSFEEAGVEVFMPDFLQPVQVPENGGYLGYYVDEETGRVCAVQYQYSGMTLEEYIEEYLYQQEDLDVGERASINALDAITYLMPDADTAVFSFYMDDTMLLDFAFYPLSDDEFMGIAELMGTSVQPIRQHPEEEKPVSGLPGLFTRR